MSALLLKLIVISSHHNYLLNFLWFLPKLTAKLIRDFLNHQSVLIDSLHIQPAMIRPPVIVLVVIQQKYISENKWPAGFYSLDYVFSGPRNKIFKFFSPS